MSVQHLPHHSKNKSYTHKHTLGLDRLRTYRARCILCVIDFAFVHGYLPYIHASWPLIIGVTHSAIGIKVLCQKFVIMGYNRYYNRFDLYLNAHGIQTLCESLSSVVSIVCEQVDLHLWHSLNIPGGTDTYCTVVTVVWGLSRLLFDVCVPAGRTDSCQLAESYFSCCPHESS